MLFPLDDFDGIRNALEERGELVPQEAVRLVLEPVHLDGMLPVLLGEGTQAAHRAIRLFGCLDDDLAMAMHPSVGVLTLYRRSRSATASMRSRRTSSRQLAARRCPRSRWA
jgi:hypothetical protein